MKKKRLTRRLSRGDAIIEKVYLVQNFMLLFGTKPGRGVDAKTDFIFDVMRCFEKFYDLPT